MGPAAAATFGLFDGLCLMAGVGFVAIFMKAVLNPSTKPEFRMVAAERLHGRFHRWEPPGSCIDFSIAGHPACLVFVATGGPGRTRLTVSFPSPGTLPILPITFAQSFLKCFRAPGLNVGDEAFDAEHVVAAVPEALAARVFSQEARDRAIAAVRRLEGMSEPAIQLTRTELRIQVEQDIETLDDILRLVQTAEDLLGLPTAAAPDSKIELGDLRLTAGAACPVCRAALDDRVVQCDSCQSPHHAECWIYEGRCATYACRGKRFIA